MIRTDCIRCPDLKSNDKQQTEDEQQIVIPVFAVLLRQQQNDQPDKQQIVGFKAADQAGQQSV